MKYIHDWIAYNIFYDDDALNSNWSNYDPSPFVTLSRMKTACNGYSALFASMCLLAGINVGFVEGVPLNRPNQTTCHTWNIVQINGNYMFVDVTFDSRNYFSNNTYFTIVHDSSYLFVPPQYLILDHYPFSQCYQCLTTPESYAAFNAAPATCHGLSSLKSTFYSKGYTFSGTVSGVYQSGSSGASLQVYIPAGTVPYVGAVTTWTNFYENWTFISRQGLLATIQMLPAVPGYATVQLFDSYISPTNVLANFLVYASSYSATSDPFPYEYEPCFFRRFFPHISASGRSDDWVLIQFRIFSPE